MDSGIAALIGAAIGGATSIAATWLSEHLRNKRSNKLDQIRKDRLRRILSDEKRKWHSLEKLSAAIGADGETTAGLLLEIDARRNVGPKEVWGLISRNPYREDVDQANQDTTHFR